MLYKERGILFTHFENKKRRVMRTWCSNFPNCSEIFENISVVVLSKEEEVSKKHCKRGGQLRKKQLRIFDFGEKTAKVQHFIKKRKLKCVAILESSSSNLITNCNNFLPYGWNFESISENETVGVNSEKFWKKGGGMGIKERNNDYQ